MTSHYAVLISLFSAIGAFLFGLDIGYMASILECASFKRDVVRLQNWSDADSEVDGATAGFIVGIYSLGAVCASVPVVSAHFIDVWGRKISIGIGSFVFLVGALLQATTASVWQMCLGRFTAGMSVGLLSIVVAIYQTEVAPTHIRGSLTSLFSLMNSFGIFVACLLNYWLVDKDGGWRIAILLQCLPSGALFLGMTCLPRSPRWLAQQGRLDEARVVLMKLRSDEREAHQELATIVGSCEEAKRQGEPAWSELFRGRMTKLSILGVSLQMLQQLSGMNGFFYFGPRIFMAAGLDPLGFQTLNAGIFLLATFPATYLIDRVGRKGLLVPGAIGMCVSSLVMAIAGRFALSKSESAEWISEEGLSSSAIMVASFVFVVNYAYSWGPVVWAYIPEIFPMKYRSRGVAMSTTSNWLFNFVIAQFFPMLLNSIGFSTFYIFASCLFAATLVAMKIPETCGVMLEQIDQLFEMA